ncbi:uncharacterized protein MELLADRAFT_95233 [Melampsora larici-populina 98AG31]|uniref:Uncharacterized protein n=1 Tax=Melampsora larici-populina (strain 98AG31 / pathotype 3-4-7) TaxID=747676 RepID=F4RCL9_MELLP|nr:uncharacterized protein MELLADRAFT_95233 [Melampsora larici-populina 98AG31]EGG09941.1 hypothetical protein MELLADRAFT_95233 [Melampsora larici-populina 98AG31]
MTRSKREKQKKSENLDHANKDDSKHDTLPTTTSGQKKTGNRSFVTCFPGLTPENFEQQVDKWTVADLRQRLVEQQQKQAHNRTRAPQDITDLTEIVCIGFEKRMLMVALMGGLPETVIWDLVNMGSKSSKPNRWIRFLAFSKLALAEKLPPRNDKSGWKARNQKLGRMWKELTSDERQVFSDPFFFALANLPDLSKVVIDDEDEEKEEDQSAQVPTPAVHQLSDEDKLKYQPLFDRMVNIEKVHITHGSPKSTSSMATLQLKSLAAFRKAHHAVSPQVLECKVALQINVQPSSSQLNARGTTSTTT